MSMEDEELRLNHKIATRVMGWTWDAGKRWYKRGDESIISGYTADGGYYSGAEGFYPFSEEVSAAFEILKKFPSWSVRHHFDNCVEVTIGVDKGKERYDSFVSRAATVPLAICLAALETLECTR